MTRIAVLGIGLACASAAGAIRQQIVPDEDVDVTAGWTAYRANDPARALAHYRRAADRNNRVAQFNLAMMLIAGEGTTADPGRGSRGCANPPNSVFAGAVRARRCSTKGASTLHGRRRSHRRGSARRPSRIISKRRSRLATQYFLGRGAPRDFKQAAQWYERAADQGEASAYIVASLYEKGEGVEQDYPRAVLLTTRLPPVAASPLR